MFEVTIKSDFKGAEKELEKKMKQALISIGMDAEGFAKDECPVDTGRLRNSITYATKDSLGVASYSDNKGKVYDDGQASGPAEENEVCIGTNVEYGIYVETNEDANHGNQGNAHFLQHAVMNHSDVYKNDIEMIFKA